LLLSEPPSVEPGDTYEEPSEEPVVELVVHADSAITEAASRSPPLVDRIPVISIPPLHFRHGRTGSNMPTALDGG
jgi:hypothetical protein